MVTDSSKFEIHGSMGLNEMVCDQTSHLNGRTDETPTETYSAGYFILPLPLRHFLYLLSQKFRRALS